MVKARVVHPPGFAAGDAGQARRQAYLQAWPPRWDHSGGQRGHGHRQEHQDAARHLAPSRHDHRGGAVDLGDRQPCEARHREQRGRRQDLGRPPRHPRAENRRRAASAVRLHQPGRCRPNRRRIAPAFRRRGRWAHCRRETGGSGTPGKRGLDLRPVRSARPCRPGHCPSSLGDVSRARRHRQDRRSVRRGGPLDDGHTRPLLKGGSVAGSGWPPRRQRQLHGHVAGPDPGICLWLGQRTCDRDPCVANQRHQHRRAGDVDDQDAVRSAEAVTPLGRRSRWIFG